MSWQAYKLVYKALSPLHIGYRQFGILKTTRYYIPGKSLWGAVTANLSRKLIARTGCDSSVYKEIGAAIEETAIFTYFFPTLEPCGAIPSFLKCEAEKEGQLPYYKFDNKAIELNILTSRASTAIEAKSLTAEDASLHEIDILSRVAKISGEPVYYIGYLFIKTDGINHGANAYHWNEGEISLKSVMGNISVGGEQKYGYGRLELVSDELVDNGGSLFDLAGYKIKLDVERPTLTLAANSTLPMFAHLEINNNLSDALDITGRIEPVVGRNWVSAQTGRTSLGPGRSLSTTVIGYEPGSIIEPKSPQSITIGKFGIWHHG